MQVVDRWHLLKNLGDALAVCYDHYPHQLRELFLDSVSEPASEPATSSAINESSLPTVTIPTGTAKLRPDQQAREERRAYWLQKFQEVEQLDAWLQEVVASQLPGLMGFVSGLQQDDDAVKAALTLPWSTGPVEGHVNRLKLMKRQMYGRANFDLLRHRVLYQV